MNKKERKNRIIARGEHSGHSHIITGDAVVTNKNGEILIEVGKEGAVLKHLMESAFIENGSEVWTKEHADIDLTGLPSQVRHGDVMLNKIGERTYKYVQQIEYNPLNKAIEKVRD